MKVAAIAVLPLLVSVSAAAQTKPLSVCDILANPRAWNDNLILLQAHYGSGMEDSFLYDTRCSGQDIWLDYPDIATKEDVLVQDKLAKSRKPVVLQRDKQLAKFERLTSVRDEKNPMCPGLDVVVTLRGRLDSKRDAPFNKNCRQPFGMCDYRARLVVESVKDVSISASKPRCK